MATTTAKPKGVARKRLPEPVRSATPLRLEDIPPATKGGYWSTQLKFLQAHPGEVFEYKNVGASNISQLKKKGLRVEGRNHRKINEAGETVAEDQPGSQVADLYVGWFPADQTNGQTDSSEGEAQDES